MRTQHEEGMVAELPVEMPPREPASHFTPPSRPRPTPERTPSQTLRPIRFSICPHTVGRALFVAVAVMTGASAVAQSLRRWVASEFLQDLLRLFKLSDENTIPALFSSLLLLACAGVLGLIAAATRRSDGPFVRHWAALALIFAYLGVDEAIEIHELLNAPLRRMFDARGFFHYPWVAPAALAVLAVAAAYRRFVVHLSPRVRRQVALAAAVFLSGAIGMEMISAKIASEIGTGTVAYGLASLIEEAMEMSGAVLFFRALLFHLSEQTNEIRLSMTQ